MTLNFWLGKLNRCQLFGHGITPLVIEVNGVRYTVTDVEVLSDCVVIKGE